jgi:hypothetical protein
VNEPLTPVKPTEDMRLPEGSAVFQIILSKLDSGELNMDMRGVLVGGPDGPATYDPLNPAHRLLAVINNHLDDLVAEATRGGGKLYKTDAGVIERRLHEGEQPGAIPEEPGIVAGLDLSAEGLAQLEQAAQQGMVNLDRAIQHELTETEAVRQDKLASLALQYNHSGNPAEAGPDHEDGPASEGFAPGTPYNGGTRDPDFDIAERQEGKGGSGLHTDD